MGRKGPGPPAQVLEGGITKPCANDRAILEQKKRPVRQHRFWRGGEGLPSPCVNERAILKLRLDHRRRFWGGEGLPSPCANDRAILKPNHVERPDHSHQWLGGGRDYHAAASSDRVKSNAQRSVTMQSMGQFMKHNNIN